MKRCSGSIHVEESMSLFIPVCRIVYTNCRGNYFPDKTQTRRLFHILSHWHSELSKCTAYIDLQLIKIFENKLSQIEVCRCSTLFDFHPIMFHGRLSDQHNQTSGSLKFFKLCGWVKNHPSTHQSLPNDNSKIWDLRFSRRWRCRCWSFGSCRLTSSLGLVSR
jgi:hypothetical protein